MRFCMLLWLVSFPNMPCEHKTYHVFSDTARGAVEKASDLAIKDCDSLGDKVLITRGGVDCLEVIIYNRMGEKESKP